MKQVDTCEYYPEESVKTNIEGTFNILAAATRSKMLGGELEAFCFVSTDKACNPVNVYGMCKAISEKAVLRNAVDNPLFRHVVVRYGNVLSSKGSVLPLFMKQAADPGDFTLTDERMTRFMMTLDQSVNLICNALDCGLNGDVWIPSLDSMRISDLAEFFSIKHGKGVKVTGVRPGEKIHEILHNEEESRYTRPILNNIVVNRMMPMPAMAGPAAGKDFSSSDCVISKEELARRMTLFMEGKQY